MLRLLSFLVILGFAVPAAAQEQSIEDVISSQLQAFNDRDVEAAWQYASPMIKGIFGTPDNFGMMVRNGYPMVWRPGDVQFLELREEQGLLIQKVMIQDQAGQFFVLDYQMIPNAAGDGWLINGVQIERAPQMGA